MTRVADKLYGGASAPKPRDRDAECREMALQYMEDMFVAAVRRAGYSWDDRPEPRMADRLYRGKG